jgi:hypothetical protein
MTTTAVKERPILFSAPMVNAILSGTKTVTRLVVKPQPVEKQIGSRGETTWFWGDKYGSKLLEKMAGKYCPYGSIGERLWVREAFLPCKGCGTPCKPSEASYVCFRDGSQVFGNGERYQESKLVPDWEGYRFSPSIHMPRWASRITLEITAVKVERLQDISAKDILAEGVVTGSHDCEAFARIGANPKCPISAFDGAAYPDLKSLWAAGWEAINGKGSWAANPFVWCVSFKPVSP